MSITLIFTIIKFIKKHWKECLSVFIISICFITILKMSIQLKMKQRDINKHLEQIVILQDENEYLETEVQGLNEKIEDLKNFNSAFDKAKRITIYEMSQDVIEAYTTFSNSFFNTQKGGTN